MAKSIVKHKVILTVEQRADLERMVRQTSHRRGQKRWATILLLADEAHPDGRRTDLAIAAEVGISVRQLERLRKKYVAQGFGATLVRATRSDAGVPKILDGQAEAHLVTLCCSEPPEGRERWTLQLLCRELARGKVVTSVCPETVRTCLKNQLKPWKTERFCIPPTDRPRFVAAMETVLDTYQASYDAQHPLICMDEASRQLLSDVFDPLPLKPGQPKRIDDKYDRHGTCSLFMFYNPIAGWRRVGCRDSRTAFDWAEEVRHLLEVDYPDAKMVTLVCDNLNTHHISSLYKAFDGETAGRLRRRLNLVYTPVNGSWLNIAEMELSVMSRQCLGQRRFETQAEMASELRAWETARNAMNAGTHWQFTTTDARVKLKALYPIPDNDR